MTRGCATGDTLTFPYGSLGSFWLLEPSARRQTFFATEILSFLPDVQHVVSGLPFGAASSTRNRALYRDASRRVEVWLDSAMLHHVVDP